MESIQCYFDDAAGNRLASYELSFVPRVGEVVRLATCNYVVTEVSYWLGGENPATYLVLERK